MNQPKGFPEKLFTKEWVKDPLTVYYVCYATGLLNRRRGRGRRRRRNP